MKQYQPTQVMVKGYRCYITRFGAIYATKIFGDLVKTLSPLLSLLTGLSEGLDTQITPNMIQEAFTALDGATLERYIHALLLDYENIMIEHDGETERLTENVLNNLFMGQVDGIFSLMFEVIKDNYGSFFDSAESPFGKVLARVEKIVTAMETLTDTENLTKTNLQGSN